MMRAPTTTITQDEAWAGFSWQDSEAEVVKQWRVTLEDLVPPDAQESARSPDRLRPPARPELTPHREDESRHRNLRHQGKNLHQRRLQGDA